MRLYLLDLKNIRFHFFVPMAAALIFVPLTVWAFYQNGSTQDIVDASSYIQMYLPFLSIWWVVFVLRQYADGSGRELLHMQRKSQALQCLFMQALFLGITAAPYLVLSFFYEGMLYEYLRIAVQSFFLSSLAYCILFTLRSATAAILVDLLYVAATWFVKLDWGRITGSPESWLVQHDPMQYVNIFSTGMKAAELSAAKWFVPAVAGLVFLLAGCWRNRRLFR